MPTTVARRHRFVDGRKEDWKYWTNILDQNATVVKVPEVSYSYQVRSTFNHLKRKSSLVSDQYRFFADFVGLGRGVRSLAYLFAHCAIQGYMWLVHYRLGERGSLTYHRSSVASET